MAVFYVGIAVSVSATLVETLGKNVTEKTIEWTFLSAIVKYKTDLMKNVFESQNTCLSMRKTREIVTYRYYIRHGIYSVWPHKHPQFILESHCSLALLFPLSLSVEWGNVETGRRVLTSCLKSPCLYKQPSISQPLPRQNKYVFLFDLQFLGETMHFSLLLFCIWGCFGGRWGGGSIVSWVWCQ